MVKNDPEFFHSCRRQARALLRNVREMGVLVRLNGSERDGELVIRDRDRRLTPLLRAQIAELRGPIREDLAAAETLPAFAASGRYLAVRSAVLGGETVVFAGDHADLAGEDFAHWRLERGLPEHTAVYRARELAALIGVTPEHLRLIHDTKTTFGGEVTP